MHMPTNLHATYLDLFYIIQTYLHATNSYTQFRYHTFFPINEHNSDYWGILRNFNPPLTTTMLCFS